MDQKRNDAAAACFNNLIASMALPPQRMDTSGAGAAIEQALKLDKSGSQLMEKKAETIVDKGRGSSGVKDGNLLNAFLAHMASGVPGSDVTCAALSDKPVSVVLGGGVSFPGMKDFASAVQPMAQVDSKIGTENAGSTILASFANKQTNISGDMKQIMQSTLSKPISVLGDGVSVVSGKDLVTIEPVCSDGTKVAMSNAGSTILASLTSKQANVSEDKQILQLKSSWSFWFLDISQVPVSVWFDQLKLISTFSTEEAFKLLYKMLPEVVDLSNGASYYMFRDNIKPMWEHQSNINGGRWIMALDNKNRGSLHKIWFVTLQCLIEEVFGEDGKEVCGAALDIRSKKDKISIWTSNCYEEKSVLNIGRTIKDRLKEHFNGRMIYVKHGAKLGVIMHFL